MNYNSHKMPDDYDLDDPAGKHASDSAEPHDDSYSIEDDDDAADGDAGRSGRFPDGDEDSDPDDESMGEETEEGAPSKKRPSAWRLLLGMMINPVEGWKKIRRAGDSVEDVAKDCFYPLTALAAGSCFLECLWKSGISLNQATVDAIKVFVAFFFGNFLVLLLMKWIFPKSHKDLADTDFCKKYVMYNLATLALFYILYECLPMVGPVLVFLPIWTIYLALRGSRFFRLPQENANLLKTLICVFIIGAPVAVYSIMDLFL